MPQRRLTESHPQGLGSATCFAKPPGDGEAHTGLRITGPENGGSGYKKHLVHLIRWSRTLAPESSRYFRSKVEICRWPSTHLPRLTPRAHYSTYRLWLLSLQIDHVVPSLMFVLFSPLRKLLPTPKTQSRNIPTQIWSELIFGKFARTTQVIVFSANTVRTGGYLQSRK